MPTEGFDFKREGQSGIILDRLGFEIDRQAIAFFGVASLEELFDLIFAQSNRQGAVFKTVVVEDVREGWSDHRPKAVVIDRPDGVFTTRATSEIASCQEDRSAAIAG